MSTAGRVSVIIPACNEGFLQATLDSLLTGAAGDVEILAVLDGGPWPNPPLRSDPRVIVLRHNQQQGMRQSFNAASQIATGQYLMKSDGHCLFAEGWDATLKADCDGDWLVVPTRHSIDGARWKAGDVAGAVQRRDFNYHYLTFPYALSMYGYGLHGKTFSPSRDKATPRTPSPNAQVNKARAASPIDDLMSFQGSCWFTTAANFQRLGPLDWGNYYFYAESIETGMRQWASGGRVVINKHTWYAHYHKGPNDLHTIDGRQGRGFFLNVRRKRASEAFATDFWLNDRWPGTELPFRRFIEQFWWLLERAPAADQWPADWDDPRYRLAFEARPPDQIPAHT